MIGALLIDKPSGPTSHDVVRQVRCALGLRAVGHTGTLDPFASGLLVLLVGRATRVARFLEGLPKTYRAVVRLGVRTDTDDRTGSVIGEPVDARSVSADQVRSALARVAGEQRQRPPACSAKHVRGVRSYRRARRGEAVEPAEVPVTVHAAELLEYRPGEATIRWVVSAGTYVRALARDLGEALGVGAHLAELRREAVGPLRLDDALPLARVGPEAVLPLGRVLGHLPSVALSAAERAGVRHGRAVMDRWTERPTDGGAIALLADGQVVAVARRDAGMLRPIVVLEAE
ncbi:MAG TPA: tRNA pseudouridine(55) synthase TruB [Gemmatimonadales bacterium]|nr:tRNA pseudouridine(55) synthase TruB [Gemmatimonadales bacterium]